MLQEAYEMISWYIYVFVLHCTRDHRKEICAVWESIIAPNYRNEYDFFAMSIDILCNYIVCERIYAEIALIRVGSRSWFHVFRGDQLISIPGQG